MNEMPLTHADLLKFANLQLIAEAFHANSNHVLTSVSQEKLEIAVESRLTVDYCGKLLNII